MKTTAAATPTFAYVGCFSPGKGDGHGEGISVFQIEQATGTWNLVQIVDTLPSPGFLALDRQHKFLYSGHGNGAEISAYAIEQATGKLELINRQPTGGENGLHLDVDPHNRYVVLANGPGMAIFPINQDGSLAPYTDSNLYEGSAHHQVLFDPTGRYIVAPDYERHKVHVFKFDATSGKLIKTRAFAIDRPNAGPRHLAFHPTQPWWYDANKNSTITAYNWDPQRGELKPFQTIRTVPDTFDGKSSASEIAVAPTGKFVYVSNRGHESTATFAVDQNNGMLKAVAWEPIKGKHPRFFALDASGSFLYSANLESDCIVIFQVDNDTGKLTHTGQIVKTGSPTCIAFAYH